MSKFTIEIRDNDTGQTNTIPADGYLLLYLAADKVKFTGEMDIRSLGPVIAKIALERMSK